MKAAMKTLHEKDAEKAVSSGEIKTPMQRASLFYSKPDEVAHDVSNHPYTAEYLVGLLFVFLMGFIGVQKASQVDLSLLNDTLCKSSLALPYVSCETNKNDELAWSDKPNKPAKTIQLIKGMNQSADAPSLRTQFAYFPDLSSSLEKLKWNGGDEQDAARFLSVITALENGRSTESGIASSLSSILDVVWNKYPDIVATSHCLNCNRFYQHILEPYFKAGSKNNERIKQIALGHPRFLQAIYQSGQLKLTDVKSIARLQAELLSSEDAKTARFIGKILREDNDLESLHHWSSKGWNGSFALSEYQFLLTLPENIIVDAWERGVLTGSDNAVLTRYLVSTGYRPALRWLLWVHAGNLSYFQNTTYQAEKDRYNDLILSLYIDFPAGSKDDLTGFYSKHWQDIVWDKAKQKWVLKV